MPAELTSCAAPCIGASARTHKAIRQVRESLADRADAVVFFEVPNGLFTLDRLGIWDIIHEHVSYVMPSSLVQAFQCAGFRVCCAGSALTINICG